MPTEAPANPNLKSAGSQNLQLSALNARSPADVFAESGGAPPPDDPVDKPNFGAELKAAQARDKGSSVPTPATPEPAKDSQAQPATASAPKVPSLPDPVDDWKPRGETAKHFDTLKQKHAAERAEWEARIKATEAQLQAFQKNGHPEFETIKKERDQYKTILKDVAIERDPQFKTKYDTQTKVVVDAAKLAAGDHGDKLGKLLAYPNSPWRDEQISKLVEELPASAKRRVEAALLNLEQIDLARSTEIESARQTFDEKQSAIMTQQKEREAAMKANMGNVFEGIHKEWTSKHPFFQKKQGDSKEDIAYNTEVDQSIELARQIFMGEQSAEELAQAAFWAASGSRVLKGYMQVVKELEQANKALDRMRGVQPGDGRSGAVDIDDSPAAPPSGGTESLRYFGRGLQEAQRMDAMRKRGAR